MQNLNILCLAKSDSFSKSQYERHFKAWGLRKNLKRKELPEVFSLMKKSLRWGNGDGISYKGISVDTERFTRLEARCCSSDTQQSVPQGMLISELYSPVLIRESFPAAFGV
jgi:hypothetical protein